MECLNRHLSSMRNPDQAEEIVSSLVEMATKIFRLQATPVYQFNDMINLIQLYRKCTQQIPTNKNQSVVSQKKKKKRKPIS